MVGIRAVMVTSFKRTYVSIPQLPGLLYSVPLTLQQATVDSASAGDSLLAHSLVGSLILSPGSWCTQGFVVSSKSLFLQSWGSSITKSHWSSKSDSLGVLPLLDLQVWKSVVGPRISATVHELLLYNCALVCESSAAALLWG